MARECAFCPETANLTGEHIWSDWMAKFFPGKKVFRNRIADFQRQRVIGERQWVSPKLDWKANVVCATCNNTWMSRIEDTRAKPAMEALITGSIDIPIDQSRANDIAIFAFKTSVILDHLVEERPRFFPRSIRHGFRTSLAIPGNVSMWFMGYLPRGGGGTLSSYFALSPPEQFELYVCNYRIGHFAFEVVADKKPFFIHASPSTDYQQLAVPFWPRIPDGFIWPPSKVLLTAKEFVKFAERWGSLNLRRFTS